MVWQGTDNNRVWTAMQHATTLQDIPTNGLHEKPQEGLHHRAVHVGVANGASVAASARVPADVNNRAMWSAGAYSPIVGKGLLHRQEVAMSTATVQHLKPLKMPWAVDLKEKAAKRLKTTPRVVKPMPIVLH